MDTRGSPPKKKSMWKWSIKWKDWGYSLSLSPHIDVYSYVIHSPNPWAGFAHTAVERGQWGRALHYASARSSLFSSFPSQHRCWVLDLTLIPVGMFWLVYWSLIFSVPLNTRQKGYHCQIVGQKDLSEYRTKNEEEIVTWDLVHCSSTPKEPTAVGTSVGRNKNSNKASDF